MSRRVLWRRAYKGIATDALTLLRRQALATDDPLAQVFASVTTAQGAWRLPGGTTNAIAPTLVHAYHPEDRFVSEQGGRKALFDVADWGARCGFDPAAPWAESASLDPMRCRDYARAVRAATAEYLAALDPATLGREIATPRGPLVLGERLALVLVIHKLTHLGAIAALLGCQGERGFPF